MPSNTASRVRKHRVSLRDAGLRPIQIWVPNSRAPGFIEECRRQSSLVASAEQNDHYLMSFLEEVLVDLNAL